MESPNGDAQDDDVNWFDKNDEQKVIFLHALTGVDSYTTMRIQMFIKNAKLIFLIDSGNTVPAPLLAPSKTKLHPDLKLVAWKNGHLKRNGKLTSEYWYNTSFHTAANITPYQVVYGQPATVHRPYFLGGFNINVG